MTLTTRDADVSFAELICADSQWLRAEFDALIQASFGEPPAPPPPAPPRVPPGSGPPASSRWSAAGPVAGASPAATGPEPGRQRSPPARLPGRP